MTGADAGVLLFGVVLGVVVVLGGMVATGTSPRDVNADAICNERLNGSGWAGEQVDANFSQVMLECTRDNRTERIGVKVKAVVEDGS